MSSDQQRRRPDLLTVGMGVGGAGALGAGIMSNKITYRVNSRHRQRIDNRISGLERAHGADAAGNPVPKLHVPSNQSKKKSGKEMAQAMARASSPEERERIRESMKPKPHPNSAANKENYQRKLSAISDLRQQRNVPRISDAARNKGRYAAFTAGSLGLWGAGRRMADDNVRKYERRDADVAALAVPVGVVAYQAPGHLIGSRERKKHYPKIAEDKTHSEVRRRHRESHGIPANAEKDHPGWHKYHKTYPKSLPGSRMHRLTARTHTGKTGVALTGLAGTGTAVGAVSTDRRRREKVGKSLYVREERVSPTRFAQLGAGTGLAAIGLSRSGMVGRALAHGLRQAEASGNRQAVTALQRAMALRGQVRAGTAPTAAQLRQIKSVDRAVRAVPGPLRGDVAAAAGLLMAANAGPVRQTSYRPAGPRRY